MLADLPIELLQHIYAQLDSPRDLRSLCLTCRYLNDVSKGSMVLRSLHDNIFDPTAEAEIEIDSLLKARWGLRQRRFPTCPHQHWSLLARLILEMQHGGKNKGFLYKIHADDILTFIWREEWQIPTAQDTQTPQAFAQSLSILLLACSTISVGSELELEQLQLGAQDVCQDFDIDIALVVFTTEFLFSTEIVRQSDKAVAHSSIAPIPFAGNACYSTADLRVFAGIMMLVLGAFYNGVTAGIFRHPFQRPQVQLSAESAQTAPERQTNWCGIYIFLDYRAFQYLHHLDRIEGDDQAFSYEDCASDGEQTCQIIMEDDGTISGHGRGTYGRAHGGVFLIKGTWTRIKGLPQGYRRISFHKEYRNEQYQSHWLYDGIHIPGHQFPHKALFLGRWKDDTARWNEDAQVTGPFIFWQTP